MALGFLLGLYQAIKNLGIISFIAIHTISQIFDPGS